jgi:hypothetical protein
VKSNNWHGGQPVDLAALFRASHPARVAVPQRASESKPVILLFVEESYDGPLFAKGSYKRVLEFVRTVVTDERVQPNHAWRHRFKSISRNAGFDPQVVDAIQGHAPRASGGNYGDVAVEAMTHRAILNQTTFDDALMWDAEPERSDRSQWSNIGTEPADHDF